MRIDNFRFGSIRIDGRDYDYDVVIQGSAVAKRKKKASKPYRDDFGHTPLSVEEAIPWKCRRLVIGTGAEGRLPVMTEVESEANRRGVELVVAKTDKAIRILNRKSKATNAIIHVTC